MLQTAADIVGAKLDVVEGDAAKESPTGSAVCATVGNVKLSELSSIAYHLANMKSDAGLLGKSIF